MKSPFKFLDSYSVDDREIFFGRDKEIDELYNRLLGDKILLVYGESGTGKSSLINCGLINKLPAGSYLPVFIRRTENMLESFSGAVQNLLNEYHAHQLLTSLMFKKAIREVASDSHKHLLFIFDQFEELFVFGSKEEILSLVQVLKVLKESDLDCRFIFILREEYFSSIAEFEKHIPDFLSNRLRIERMDRTNAITAIKGSCNVNDIELEAGFAENLLNRLNPGNPGTDLTYLQIFLDRVFNLMTDGNNQNKQNHVFTNVLLDKTGDVTNLLGTFLDAQLSTLSKPDVALTILKSFVSYKGTRRLLNLAEVKDNTNTLGDHVSEKNIIELIGSLVNLRILCEKNADGYYELRHDALAGKIFEKISASEIELLEARQFIENAYHFWKKHDVLLSEDDLKYIDRFRNKLSLSGEFTGLLNLSRETHTTIRNRRRKLVISGGIIIIVLLSAFSIWALSERNIADRLKIKALAEKYNLLATNVSLHDPTKGLRIAEYAMSMDSSNQNIKSNITRIYSDNAFYKLIARQEDAIAKQEDAITAVVFSPDSKYLLTGSGDATARLWDLEGNQIRIFIGHSGYVNSVAFSPDGRSVLSASTDRSARLWDLNGRVISDFKGHSMSVNSVAFSPDGKKILTGSSDMTARLWDLNGNVIRIFKGHKSNVTAVAYSPDGRLILTGSSDSTARLWNTEGKVILVIRGHKDNVNTVTFSPDGQLILTGSNDKTAKLWDLQGKLIKVFTGFPGEVTDVLFSPDGKKILIGASAGYTILYDLNGNEIREFKGHTIQVKAVAFSPDGTKIATGSGDCTAKLWDLNDNISQVFEGHSGKITSIQFSSDGKTILSGSMDKTVRLWDLNGNTLLKLQEPVFGINDAILSPDGKSILTCSDEGTAKLWDLHGKVIRTFRGHRSGVKSVAFSPDGRKILTGSQDATARLWDLNGNNLMVFKGHLQEIRSVAFSSDGQKILTGSSDYSARLWDLDGHPITILRGQSSNINAVAFSPDGSTFLTGTYGSDPSARLWDLKGNLIKVFNGHTTSILAVSFSPDGKRILTGSADQSAILWNLNGDIEQVFSGYRSYVTSVAFSPDGRSILIGLDNGMIRLYPVKKPYNEFRKIDRYEKLSAFDQLSYGIKTIKEETNSEDQKVLLQTSEFNINEAIHSGGREKINYLTTAIDIYKRILESNPDRKEYLLDLLRAYAYAYQAKPSDSIKTEIGEINSKILNLTSAEDLKLAAYSYCLVCAKNSSSTTQLAIPDCFLAICSKLLKLPYLTAPEKQDISRWCSFLGKDLIEKKEFAEAQLMISMSMISDSTNIVLPVLLPISHILNNQYDKAAILINKFKNRPLTGIDFFKNYPEALTYYLKLLEDISITHPDFEKARELLK